MGRDKMPITNDADLGGNTDQEAQVTNSHASRGRWFQNEDAELEASAKIYALSRIAAVGGSSQRHSL